MIQECKISKFQKKNKRTKSNEEKIRRNKKRCKLVSECLYNMQI